MSPSSLLQSSLGTASPKEKEPAMRKVCAHKCAHTHSGTPSKSRNSTCRTPGARKRLACSLNWKEASGDGTQCSRVRDRGEAGEQAKADHAWPCRPRYGECHAGSGRGVPRCDYLSNRPLCCVKSRFREQH